MTAKRGLADVEVSAVWRSVQRPDPAQDPWRFSVFFRPAGAGMLWAATVRSRPIRTSIVSTMRARAFDAAWSGAHTRGRGRKVYGSRSRPLVLRWDLGYWAGGRLWRRPSGACSARAQAVHVEYEVLKR